MSDLSSQTINRAMIALQGNRSSGLPEIVELVQTLSEKALEISVQELAQVVEKDTAVLTRILTIANAFGYNPSGIPINTVSGAIQVIGFERIRTLAISLLLVEQSNRQQTLAERREAATYALFSGCLAKAMADRGLGVDAEEAFVCASLRHFGRIVLSTFMTDEYRQALLLTAEYPEDESFKKVFGLTPLELSYELLRAEQLPEEILGALKKFSPEAIQSVENPAVRCHALADFASRVCSMVFNPNLGQDEFEARSKAVAQRYARVFPALWNEFSAVLPVTEGQLRNFYEGVGSKVMPRECLSHLQHRIAKIDPLKPAKPQPPAPPKEKDAAKRGEDGGSGADPETGVGGRGFEEELLAWERLAAREDATEAEVHRGMLTLLSRALKAGESVLFLSGGDQRGALRVVQGVGRVWPGWADKAAVQPGERTALGLCLVRKENILIHDARDRKLEQHLPAWLHSETSLGAYVLIPVLDRRRGPGLVLAGWAEPRRIELSPGCVAVIHRINRALARA